jgi:serine/threonine-protein kinase RsbW
MHQPLEYFLKMLEDIKMSNYQFEFRTLEEFRPLRCLIKSHIHRILGENGSFLMDVAINEAVNNAIRSNDARNWIKISIRVTTGQRLIIRIKDQGKGFNARKVLKELSSSPDYLLEKKRFNESGRGLSIIKLATDKMFYNCNGNEVLLMKNINHQWVGTKVIERAEVFG